MVTTAEAVARELGALGTEHFFLVTGGDNALWLALRRRGIQQVLARNEASAVYMADGYARITGRPTYVYGQYGPGAANVAGALAEPWWSSSPVVAMPTAMRRHHRHRDEYQELEQIQLFTGVTRWQAEAVVPEQAPRLVRMAAREALAPPPRPVYAGISSDILEQEIPDYAGPAREPELQLPLGRTFADPGDVEEALELMAAAQRPLILAGNGVHLSRGERQLARVAEALDAPVVTSLSGKGAIAEVHRLSFGTVGRYSRRYANDTVREADVILAIGTRLGGLVTDSYRLIGPDTRVVQVDADPSALGRNHPVTLGVTADADSFVQQMLDLLSSENAPASISHQDWIAELTERRSSWESRRRKLAEVDGTGGDDLRPEAVLSIVNEIAPDETVIVADTGYAAAWAGALYETRRAGNGFLRADGSLGWAFPASLGAKLAAPSDAVVCVTGDGGFGYHIGELETARRLGIPTITIVLNNRALAFEAHIQEHIHGEIVDEVNDFADVDYAEVARAFGVRGRRVSRGPEFRDAFTDALRSEEPTVIDVLIDETAIGPVTRYDAVREREL